MSKDRWLMILGITLTLVVAAGVADRFLWAGKQAAAEKPAPDKAASPVLAGEFPHPLDPLSKDELTDAVKVLQAADKLPKGVMFPIVALKEPPKEEVLAFQTGKPMRREALAVVLDREANKTHEAVIDLKAKKLLSFTEVPGIQPGVLLEEFESAGDIVREDERWQAAMKKRGIKDFKLVQLDVWAAGTFPALGGEKGARLLRVLSFYRGDAVNPYARPIEGVVATVNVNTGKVVDLMDSGVVKLADESSDFFDAAAIGPMRQAPKPLVISQPQGASFEVRGHEVRWQKWRFRYALHPREGLVLYAIGIEEGDRVRPILYRASLAEMVVPYGDPSNTWVWRNAFDQGEYGLGRLANTLEAGEEVPENALLLDATFADDTGVAYEQPRAVALFERDGGMLWTHADTDAKKIATRRARELVISYLVTIGNYDYGLEWIFHQDGVLEVKAVLSGIMLAKGVAAEKCAVCLQKPDGKGTVTPVGEDRYGTLVAKNVLATNHQHFFCFRLDFDVDGAKNSVKETNVRPVPPGEANTYKNAFLVEQTRFRTELEARRELSLATHRTWKIFNPGVQNSLGHYSAYMLEPGSSGVPYMDRDTILRRRAGFIDYPLWVTKQRPNEMYAAGTYPNQSEGGDGLPKWTADDESIENEDIVLWYTFAVTHVPRVEEWPVMPATRVGFRLLPDGFFTRNPALDVPGKTRKLEAGD